MTQIPVSQILKRAADECGFKRIRYSEKNIPTAISNVTVLLFLGDIRSSFILSSLLLRRFKEESKGSRYFILASWAGNQALFPYVDEYWEINEENHLRTLYNKSNGFNNNAEAFSGYRRLLNNFFEEVIDASVFEPFYQNGFKQDFFDRYSHIKRYLPSIPSSAILGNEFNRRLNEQAYKVVIYPVMYIQDWKNGKFSNEHVPISFWESLVDRLLSESIIPVIYQNFHTYDLSPKFINKCVYLSDPDISHVLAGMRAAGCVLDLFSGVSRLAIAARCPYVYCQDRQAYNYLKEFEVDILCGKDIPHENYYVFPSISNEINKNHWNSSLFDGIIIKLTGILQDTNRDDWPSPTDIYEMVQYEPARKVKRKKFGTRFIKVPKY